MLSSIYLTIFMLVLAFTGHALYSITKIKQHLHMLQLNSYFNGRYLHWLKLHSKQVFQIKKLEPLVALIGVFFQKPLLIIIIFTSVYGKMFLGIVQEQQKKPLIMTARAWRIFGTNLLLLGGLYLLTLLALLHSHENLFIALLVILVLSNFIQPFITVLTNTLVLPLEKFIQYRYRYAAQRLLQQQPQLKIIGITGSFGKTSTKHILTAILRTRFNTLKTPASYNTPMGITKTVLQELTPLHEIFVVEMSAKLPGDIQELCQLVKPQWGIITSIGEQHLETFKTFANIQKTKAELINALPNTGVAFLNADDETCRKLISQASCRVVTYGIDHEADYRATQLHLDENGAHFILSSNHLVTPLKIQTRLLGKHNISNILGAAAIALELGIDPEHLTAAIKKIPPVEHRLQLMKFPNDILYLDDAFNANPIGCKNALETLAQFTTRRKIIVTPGMIELGKQEHAYNQRFGTQIADICDYVILVGPHQTIPIQQGLKEHHYPTAQCFIAQDFATAKAHLDSILQAGDIVLFANDLPDNYTELRG